MSKYTTELRFICESLAGYEESVGLSSVDEVIKNSMDKIFDFDYPIFDEEYRSVLQTKILLHFYTREIGYETVGRWKLALRSKMLEIMPYYNELYKKSAQFGRVNIFDDVAYNISKSVAEIIDKTDNENVVSNVIGSDDKDIKTSNNKVTNHSSDVNVNEDKEITDEQNTTRNESGSDNRSEVNLKNGEVTESRRKEEIVNENSNYSSEKENEYNDRNVVDKNDSYSNTQVGNTNKNNREQGNTTNNSSSTSNNETNSVKRQLYSDTPSGALDFGELDSDTGSGGADGISNTYITNLTKNIDNNASSGSSNTVGSSASKVDTVSDEFNSSNESGKTDSSEIANRSTNGGETESGNRSNSVNGNETFSGNIVSNDSDSSVENKNYTKSDNIVDNKRVNESYSNTTTKTGNGSENNNGTERVSSTNNRSENVNKNANGVINSTESYIENVIGKRGNKTYSAMFIEFMKSIKNIDQMVIEELDTLFFGLW